MEFKFIIGVDISKEWFDFCLTTKHLEILWEGKVDNNPDSIFNFITELQQKLALSTLEDIVIVLEYTGIYVQHLVNCWLSKGARLSIVPATKVSAQLGQRLGKEEKTDAIDARRLAEYGIRFSDKLKIWKAKGHTVELLQRLHAQRKRFTDIINKLQVPANESKDFDSTSISEEIENLQKESLNVLKKSLKQIETRIAELIKKDETLSLLYKQITSISGVGSVTAIEVILATNVFTKFKPNEAKSFARYAGVSPNKWQSGKVKKRDRTSKQSNRKIKTILTMGATSLIGTKDELGKYYERKIAEGKPHFLVLNAMRNKLILRIFAVVRNQVMYKKNLNLI